MWNYARLQAIFAQPHLHLLLMPDLLASQNVLLMALYMRRQQMQEGCAIHVSYARLVLMQLALQTSLNLLNENVVINKVHFKDDY